MAVLGSWDWSRAGRAAQLFPAALISPGQTPQCSSSSRPSAVTTIVAAAALLHQAGRGGAAPLTVTLTSAGIRADAIT